MDIIATDLDRTLFPNGKQPYDDTMPLFRKVIEERGFPLIYVTGRNTNQIQEGIEKYNPPLARYAIAEVGTRVYKVLDDGTMSEDDDYIAFIREHTPNWDIEAFRDVLAEVPSLRMQEAFNQNQFKLSYYVDDLGRAQEAIEAVKERIRNICEHTNIIYSVDETIGQGLLDILPTRANKMEGLEYVRDKLGASRDDVIFCGDSGNDMQPLTFGYRAILVRNAIDEVRAEVAQVAEEKGFPDKVYFPKGTEKLNGHYVSGILEGLLHFGVITEDDLS
jgi:hypothetical protein